MSRFNILHFFLLFLVIFFFSLITHAQPMIAKAIPCLEFRNRLCIRCPEFTHFKDQQCYQNINDCAEYQYGSASALCRQYRSQSSSVITTVSQVTASKSTSFVSSTSASHTSSSYSALQSALTQVAISQSLKDPFFVRCNDHMRKGQYSHFISRSENPIKSVFHSMNQDFRDFKILYEGSGGNLLMCLIGINTKTNSILLKSFVTIGRTQIIEDCVDYTSVMECDRCKDKHHLDSSINGDATCVQDIPGCIEYYGNICTKCRGHYFLIENRCASDCQALRDSRSLKFYGACNVPGTQTLAMEVARDYFV